MIILAILYSICHSTNENQKNLLCTMIVYNITFLQNVYSINWIL